jgi:hypothetical protein
MEPKDKRYNDKNKSGVRSSNSTPKPFPFIEGKNEPEWNSGLEFAAKDIGEIAGGYKMMHIAAAQKASRAYMIVMFLGIIIGPITGVLSGVGQALDQNPSPSLIPILVTVMSFLSGVIVSVIKFGKYDEVSTSNKVAAARYTSLEGNVRRQLALYREDRPPARKYLEWLNNSYDELFLSAPLVPRKVYENYLEYAKKHGLIVPNQYEHTIVVNNDHSIHASSEGRSDILVNQSKSSLPITARPPDVSLEPTLKPARQKIEIEYLDPEYETDEYWVEPEQTVHKYKKRQKEDLQEPNRELSYCVNDDRFNNTPVDVGTCKTASVGTSDNITVGRGLGTPDISLEDLGTSVSSKIRIKRSNTLSRFSDMSKFNDGLMDYEIKRMMGN